MDAEKSDADNDCDTGCSPQILGKCGCVAVKPRYSVLGHRQLTFTLDILTVLRTHYWHTRFLPRPVAPSLSFPAFSVA